MALAANTLPIILPDRPVPFDVATAFCQAQTLTATGYFNNIQAQVDIGPGRFDGMWTFDVSALDLSSTDEVYGLYLLGSNDAAWTSGNIDMIAAHDFAATAALRRVPTICAASPAVPLTGKSSTRHVIRFSNHMGGFIFRYLQMYLIAAGTTPSITLSSWISPEC